MYVCGGGGGEWEFGYFCVRVRLCLRVCVCVWMCVSFTHTASPVTPESALAAEVKGDDKVNTAVCDTAVRDTGVRESPHGKLAFLDVLAANGANDGLVQPLRCVCVCVCVCVLCVCTYWTN